MLARHARLLGKCLLLVIASVFVFTALTAVHGMIPNSLVIPNMERSLAILDSEGVYPQVGELFGHAKLMRFAGEGGKVDNFTNMWMVQSVDSDHYYDYAEYNDGEPYDASRRESVEGNLMVKAFLTGWKQGKYWSGFRVFLKPLLIVMDFNGIRILQVLISIAAFTWAAYRIGKDIGGVETLLFCISILAIYPANTLTGMAQAPDLIQAFVTTSVLLLLAKQDQAEESREQLARERDRVDERLVVLFLLTGLIEAFINCLIMPLITLGLPLTAWVLVQRKRSTDLATQVKGILTFCLAWGVGYASSYLSVWIVSACFRGISPLESLASGFGEFLWRAGGDEESLIKSVVLSIHNNISLNMPFIWLLMLVIGFMVVRERRLTQAWDITASNLALLCVSAIPFIWVIVLNNHSRIHASMSHDIFAFAMWAMCCFIHYFEVEWQGRTVKQQ